MSNQECKTRPQVVNVKEDEPVFFHLVLKQVNVVVVVIISVLADKFVEECTETVEEVELAKITSAENENSYKYKSCTPYIVSITVVSIIGARISAYFVYYNWSLVKNDLRFKFGTRTQTTI